MIFYVFVMLLPFLGVAYADAGSKPSWDISVLIDQSGSMNTAGYGGYDLSGFALLGSAILSDLSEEGDALTLYPQGRSAQDCPPVSLQVRDREQFKEALGVIRENCTGSDWHPAFGSATQSIQQAQQCRRQGACLCCYLAVQTTACPSTTRCSWQDRCCQPDWNGLPWLP